MKEKYIPTGNEYISLPDIRERDAAVLGIGFLHMGGKGMVELRGGAEHPFLKPFASAGGVGFPLDGLEWAFKEYWIPVFKKVGVISLTGMVLAPVGERGFVYRLAVRNNGEEEEEVCFGLSGCWGKTLHAVNENKEIGLKKHAYESNWNHSFIMDMRAGFPLFALAPICAPDIEASFYDEDGSIRFTLQKKATLHPGEETCAEFIWGLGFEEVAAATSAKEILRQGVDWELERTLGYLKERVQSTGRRDLDAVLNRNLFFNLFFASGITLDTEERVFVTSRSSRYYVSAAYWDRDSFFWSFPPMLLADTALAREMLCYFFEKQVKNAGVHSRYIDGTLLEPGFELDELCAPVIALHAYIKAAGGEAYFSSGAVQSGLERILRNLEGRRHPSIALYDTFLQPTDDVAELKYLTYDNVLVWKMLTALAELYGQARDNRADKLRQEAENVRRAILENLVCNADGREVYCWSADLKGATSVYDEPAGSLQLLPFHGFCSAEDPVYRNTVESLLGAGNRFSFPGSRFNELGCGHAVHPWVLSVANGLLCGRLERETDILLNAPMDNGIACESIDEETGECATGEAFATCAGFLAYSIYCAYHNITGESGEY
jgi:hypothetical protein